jgi:hypothetical protein
MSVEPYCGACSAVHVLGLNIPIPDWPLIGPSAPIAVLFTLHIAIAQFTAGAITIAPFAELWGARTADHHALHYAERMATTYYLLFSLGASLGIFSVTALLGLWGHETGILFNRFLPLMGFAFGLFLVLVPLLVLYKNTFGKMSPQRHAALGLAVAFWQNLFIVCIVGLDAFLITPQQTGFVQALFNPAYTPLLLHRLVGNVSWAALFLAGFAAIRMVRARDEAQVAYQSWCARVNLRIGLATAALMPWIGFALIEALKQSVPGYFDNLVMGQAAYLMVVQEVLLLAVLVGGNLALALENRQGTELDAAGRVAVVVCLGGMVLGVMPSQVLGGGVYWLRYAGIAVATLATLVHVVSRTTVMKRLPRLAVAPGAALAFPYTGSAAARRALVLVGTTAMALTLFMGYIKEEARGGYAIYGELTQTDARGQFTPGPQLYPPG